MRHLNVVTRCALSALALALVRVPPVADAQSASLAPTPTPTPPPDSGAPRPRGLPTGVDWKFNYEQGLGGFGFANSLYRNVRPDPSGNLSSNWAESYAKPSVSGTYQTGQSQLYTTLSVVGERTFAAPPTLVGEQASSFQVEDLSLGWRSGKSLGVGEDAVDLTFGRTQYRLGQGFLLYDGTGEGGERGGFWSNARKAWGLAGIARFKPKHHTFEVFGLERDDVPGNPEHNRLWGVNYEFSPNDKNKIGVTYLNTHADSFPARDGMHVLNMRAYVAPFSFASDLSFGGEFAREDNHERLTSTAWMAQTAYEFSKVSWKPKLQYRYAFFEGDDPSTAKSEAFDPLFPGFSDWGTWWQGEIAGEYFIANSNLISHEVRLHLAPSASVGTGLIGFLFQVDHPASFGDGVTSKDLGAEIDSYTDWKINGNFTLSVVAATAHPKKAITQLSGRTKNFVYGMLYLVYAY